MQDELADIVYLTDYKRLNNTSKEVIDNLVRWHYRELEHNVSEAYKQGYTQGAIPFITGEVKDV